MARNWEDKYTEIVSRVLHSNLSPSAKLVVIAMLEFVDFADRTKTKRMDFKIETPHTRLSKLTYSNKVQFRKALRELIESGVVYRLSRDTYTGRSARSTYALRLDKILPMDDD